MPKRDYDLVHLAGKIISERARFADIHDPLAVQHDCHKLMMLPYLYAAPPPGSPEFLLALHCANEAGWIDALLSALMAGGAMQALDRPCFAPQAIASPDLGFQDVGLQTAAGEKAKRRVCMVSATIDGKTVTGTGFLVGPQVIVTSWHVIEKLLENSVPAPGSHQKLSVQFDYCTGSTALTVGVSENWLVAFSPSHESERGKCIGYAEDMDPTGFDSCLDYAVIRLANAVGRERGYYHLDKMRKLSIPEPVTVYQHPNGYPLKSALGSSRMLWPAGIETRLRHDANTLAGASGGVLLDRSYEPIALHQGAFTQLNRTIINSAIPITCIATAKVDFESVEGVDPIWCLQRSGLPVFSRSNFQACILEGVVGKVRIVIVRGDPKSGKTFSTAILRDRLGQTEHCVAELSAREAPGSAREMARLILSKAGLGGAECDALPDAAHADTASEAWVRDVLVRDFKALLSSHAGGRTVWIVIDDLDVAPLAQTDTLFFIERLLEGTIDDTLLRFVLIGGSRHTGVCPPRYLATDYTDHIGKRDIATTIQLRAVAINNAAHLHADDTAQSIVNVARGNGGVFLNDLVRAYRQIVENQ